MFYYGFGHVSSEILKTFSEFSKMFKNMDLFVGNSCKNPVADRSKHEGNIKGTYGDWNFAKNVQCVNTACIFR